MNKTLARLLIALMILIMVTVILLIPQRMEQSTNHFKYCNDRGMIPVVVGGEPKCRDEPTPKVYVYYDIPEGVV